MPIPFAEYLNVGKAGWGIGSFIWRWLRRNKRSLTSQQKLELRAKWKPQVEAWLLKHHKERLGWRLGEYATENSQMVNLMATGFIPYEDIEMIDWNGDQYYSYPHLYCYFDFKGEPYERVAYCEKRSLDEHTYYTEVVGYQKVLKLTRRLKGRAFLKRIH